MQDSRREASTIRSGMECLSLVLFTAENDSGLPSSHLHGLKKTAFSPKGFDANPDMRQHHRPDPPHQRCPGAAAGEAGAQGRGQQKPPACCLPKEVPKLGAFSKPCPSPFNGISTYSKAGPISKHLKFAVCFPTKSCNFIYSGRKKKIFFFFF